MLVNMQNRGITNDVTVDFLLSQTESIVYGFDCLVIHYMNDHDL